MLCSWSPRIMQTCHPVVSWDLLSVRLYSFRASVFVVLQGIHSSFSKEQSCCFVFRVHAVIKKSSKAQFILTKLFPENNRNYCDLNITSMSHYHLFNTFFVSGQKKIRRMEERRRKSRPRKRKNRKRRPKRSKRLLKRTEM